MQNRQHPRTFSADKTKALHIFHKIIETKQWIKQKLNQKRENNEKLTSHTKTKRCIFKYTNDIFTTGLGERRSQQIEEASRRYENYLKYFEIRRNLICFGHTKTSNNLMYMKNRTQLQVLITNAQQNLNFLNIYIWTN